MNSIPGRFEIEYSGGVESKTRLGTGCVVDLLSVSFAPTITAFVGKSDAISNIIGQISGGSVLNDGRTARLIGRVTADLGATPAADGFVGSIRAGAKWGAEFGIEDKDGYFLEPGQTVVINGVLRRGPLVVIAAGLVRSVFLRPRSRIISAPKVMLTAWAKPSPKPRVVQMRGPTVGGGVVLNIH